MNPPLRFTIAFSPKNQLLERIVTNSLGFLNDPLLNTMSFENATVMETYLHDNNVLAGVEFPDNYEVSHTRVKGISSC